MRVFKFGGASVKDADAVRNVASILSGYKDEDIVVVVSAMGKTTNALEKLTHAFFNDPSRAKTVLQEIKNFHFKIVDELFPNDAHIAEEINNDFVELDWAIEGTPELPFDQHYDQIVSIGELISSKIVSAYLKKAGVSNKWWDARDFIQTDNTFREGNVDWSLSLELAKKTLLKHFEKPSARIVVTQGFIGATSENYTTTLGREGSDYTAALIAYFTNARDVTIWKDVPGVLNADPKYFPDAVLLKELSYLDAIELTYYGATVIHPKTIKPLQNKKIPLYVKSFIDKSSPGTVIKEEVNYTSLVPSYIFKNNQILISISPKDFSFIIEENLSDIFECFAKNQIKVNLMQNSAISFSVCADNGDKDKTHTLLDELKSRYKVLYNEDLQLITVRYYDEKTVERVLANQQLLLEQRSRNTVQMVVRE